MTANNLDKSTLEIVHHHLGVALRFDAREVTAIHASLGALVDASVDLRQVAAAARSDERDWNGET
jgi:cobyrinic acid a,c-diamide synthase